MDDIFFQRWTQKIFPLPGNESLPMIPQLEISK